jgi:hypothetical protein
MARKKVSATAGFYTVGYDFPGDEEWVRQNHAAFDEWTLRLAQEGPSESVSVLPSFEKVPADDEEPWLLRLTFVRITAESGWSAVEDTVDTLNTIAPHLLGEGTAFRVMVGAEEVIGQDVEIDVSTD